MCIVHVHVCVMCIKTMDSSAHALTLSRQSCPTAPLESSSISKRTEFCCLTKHNIAILASYVYATKQALLSFYTQFAQNCAINMQVVKLSFFEQLQCTLVFQGENTAGSKEELSVTQLPWRLPIRICCYIQRPTIYGICRSVGGVSVLTSLFTS